MNQEGRLGWPHDSTILSPSITHTSLRAGNLRLDDEHTQCDPKLRLLGTGARSPQLTKEGLKFRSRSDRKIRNEERLLDIACPRVGWQRGQAFSPRTHGVGGLGPLLLVEERCHDEFTHIRVRNVAAEKRNVFIRQFARAAKFREGY